MKRKAYYIKTLKEYIYINEKVFNKFVTLLDEDSYNDYNSTLPIILYKEKQEVDSFDAWAWDHAHCFFEEECEYRDGYELIKVSDLMRREKLDRICQTLE